MKNLEQKLTSMEVAEMVEKDHNELLKDIRRYCEQLSQGKIPQSNFFEESTREVRGKKYPCYMVTKKGCEFIANKLTGVKGTSFTARYIDRFHEMEKVIQEQIPQGKELLALAVLEAQKMIEEKDKLLALQDSRINEMVPKEIFADAVATSHTSILVFELAKILRQNGINIGGQRLFIWLRENGYLVKRRGTDWNMPTQKAMELELFEIKESTHIDGNGCNVTTKTPKVTGKGQVYFVNKFLRMAV